MGVVHPDQGDISQSGKGCAIEDHAPHLQGSMLFSKNSFICTKDAPILSSHRCLQALTRSSTVDSAVPRPSVPLFLSGVYPATSTWLLPLPLRSPRSTKGSREHVYFLIRTLPFNNTTLLLGCISLPSPPVQSSLQVTSLWSQDMSTYHLNSFEKDKLASPWS